jgi:acetyl esterase/lipase
MIHGGGWAGQSAAGLQSQAVIAQIYQRLGYETLAFDYRRGAQGIRDAEMFYRLARRRVGPNLPICALGPSAGGHISLMLAVLNPDLACVIDFAGPTDLIALASQPGGAGAYRLALYAFGRGKLGAYSPVLDVKSIRARVMLVYAQNDPIVPVAQGQEMAAALPSAQLIVLPPGPVGFVHSHGGAGTTKGVAAGPYVSSLAAEESFLAGAALSH